MRLKYRLLNRWLSWACLWAIAVTHVLTPRSAIAAEESNNPTAPLITRFAQSDDFLQKWEQRLAERVNAERVKAGLKPLAYDFELADVARAHSAEMRDRQYFAHESPTPQLHNALDRYYAAFNNKPPVVAENLYASWGGKPRQLREQDMERSHCALMRSPTHRDNILCPKLTRIGIGLVANANGDIWMTQMFICEQSVKTSAETSGSHS